MPDPDWTTVALCVAAFFGGVMNSVAGGGTLLTFPALTAVMDPLWANATSTVALLPGSLAGSVGYRQEVAANRRLILRMLGPSLAGGALGSWLATEDATAFARLVPWLILTAAVLFLVQPVLGRVVRRSAADTHPPGPGLAAALLGFQFLVAVYGGFFGAGIGILMLAALAFMGVGNIHAMNGVKTLLGACINAVSVVVFVGQGVVEWRYVGVMAGASVVGGYAGARVARRLPPRVVRLAVLAIAFGLATYYFVKQFGGAK